MVHFTQAEAAKNKNKLDYGFSNDVPHKMWQINHVPLCLIKIL